MTKNTLTQSRLKELLHYDPETGIFTWKLRISNHAGIGEEAGWSCRKGYRRIMVANKSYRSARLAFLYMTGETPEQVDHINQVHHDNRWDNLRPVTNAENLKNKTRYKNNTTGCTGVYWNKRQAEWVSLISVDSRLTQIYHGGDFFEAVCRRKVAEKKYGYHENHGNEKWQK